MSWFSWFGMADLLRAVQQTNTLLQQQNVEVRAIRWRLYASPRFGRLQAKSEETMASTDRIKYELQLLSPTMGTRTQRLEISRDNGGDPQIITLDALDQSVRFTVEEGQACTLLLFYLDEHGNESAPAVMSFVAIDKIAPAPPAGFGALVAIGELPAEDPPAEDPPAEDPPAEDPPAEDPPAEDTPAEDPADEQ